MSVTARARPPLFAALTQLTLLASLLVVPALAAAGTTVAMRAYVLSLPGNPAPGKVGTAGPYLR